MGCRARRRRVHFDTLGLDCNCVNEFGDWTIGGRDVAGSAPDYIRSRSKEKDRALVCTQLDFNARPCFGERRAARQRRRALRRRREIAATGRCRPTADAAAIRDGGARVHRRAAVAEPGVRRRAGSRRALRGGEGDVAARSWQSHAGRHREQRRRFRRARRSAIRLLKPNRATNYDLRARMVVRGQGGMLTAARSSTAT